MLTSGLGLETIPAARIYRSTVRLDILLNLISKYLLNTVYVNCNYDINGGEHQWLFCERSFNTLTRSTEKAI